MVLQVLTALVFKARDGSERQPDHHHHLWCLRPKASFRDIPGGRSSGLQIGGLNREYAAAHIETVVNKLFGDLTDRQAAKIKMSALAQALTMNTA
nr:hypothetical protein [uncultured Shimia sp.]